MKDYFKRVDFLLNELDIDFKQAGGNWKADKLFSKIADVEKQIRKELLSSRNELKLNDDDPFKKA